ncbi:MAG: hypothetical protein M1818_007836 [Claussenomyces sp. TS43310]|nr:MAG: hypothetical protein M1818_007836 [Claussenomyces sp. TS43310]
MLLRCAFNAAFAAFIVSGDGAATVSALQHPQNHEKTVKNIAIIGAGPAGSSTAYHLNKFAHDAGTIVNITVFERSRYVGGRSTTIDAYDDSSNPVELGASIFVEVNRILMKAAEEFDLIKEQHVSNMDEHELLGIWNGEKFVFTQEEGGWAWWDITKLIWKYGLAPIRTQNLMKSTVGKYLKMYEAPFFPFRSLSDRAQDLGLISITAMTGDELLKSNKIGPPFTTDIIQASTRVNYGQNLGLIHGLETMVCMAIEGARQIKGGNWQIFDRMVNSSGAAVQLDTHVTSLSKRDGKYVIQTAGTSSGEVKPDQDWFDTVVLAAPLQFSKIRISDGLVKHIPDEIPYVTLHVTLFASPLKLNESHFGLAPGAPVPSTVLTTLSADEDPTDRENIVGKSGFFSISTLRTTINPRTLQKEYLYKIFSPKAVTSEFLGSLFNVALPKNVSDLTKEASDKISWYYPHVWQAYPYEYPRITFDELELARGLYYTSGMESFISTMETSALMGMNVAQLIVDDLLGVMDENVAIQKPSEQGALKMEEL